MAKHKAGKKPVKKVGEQPVTDVAAEVFPVRENVIPLSEEESKRWTYMVIGRAVCPVCRQSIKVINDDGRKGLPIYDYIENHPKGDRLCRNSDKTISDVFP